MSWQSTTTYYQLINAEVARRLGGTHSAKLLLHSVDFAEIEALQVAGRWAEAGEVLAAAARGLVAAGAGLMLICSNTMHKVADAVATAGAPLLHIAEATADALEAEGIKKVGLLGTGYTMREDFYKKGLWARGLEVLLPEPAQMDEVNRVIFEELILGRIEESSRRFFLGLADDFTRRGAGGVILGCTEIGLLISQKDSTATLFDTTVIHAKRAVELALE